MIVAALDRREKTHGWASEKFRVLPKPFVTCEAVITEVCYLMRPSYNGVQDALFLLTARIVKIDFSLYSEVKSITSLMKKYENVPMSLADACLVRMCEMDKDSEIFTLDSDFQIYRKHRNSSIPLIISDGI